MSLNFRTVPLVESGLGKISILSDVCNQLNIKKPLIITDQGLFKLGFVEEIEKSLSIKNISPCVYNRVKADPPESNIFEAVNLFQNHKADGVIGFGGGSSMDVAKAVSYFSVNNVNIEEWLIGGTGIHNRLKICRPYGLAGSSPASATILGQ